MSYAVLEKELETLPEYAVEEVVDFIRFIKQKIERSATKKAEAKSSMFGVWKDEPFYMSNDFDEPIEDFAEYM